MTQNILAKKRCSNWTKREWFLIIIYTLTSFQFYQYTGLNNTMIKLPSFVIVPVMFFVCWKTLISNFSNQLFKLMRWLVVTIVLSIISAYMFWGQSITLSYRVIGTEFALLFYFYLMKRKPSIASLETYIFVFGARYHSVVFAINNAISFIALSYEHKIEGLLETLDLKDCMVDITKVFESKRDQDNIVAKITGMLPLKYFDRQKTLLAKELAEKGFDKLKQQIGLFQFNRV